MEKVDARLPAAVNPPRPSPLRAWFYLLQLSIQRQARAHLMVWLALGLLAFMSLFVYLNTRADRWNVLRWRVPQVFVERNISLGGVGQSNIIENAVPAKWPNYMEFRASLDPYWSVGLDPQSSSLLTLHAASIDAVVRKGLALNIFSTWIVFAIFTTFLLPLWTLSFATDGLGREREAGNLLWVLSRPISRPGIYLAKYLASLPWCCALNIGGLFILCALAGAPGQLAFRLYWPAAALATFAFAALFHLFGACFQRPAIVAILYAFFLETIAGNLPGHLKRMSLSFYARCMMFDGASAYGIRPLRPDIFLAVSGDFATAVLVVATLLFLAVGMAIFSRTEYLEAS